MMIKVMKVTMGYDRFVDVSGAAKESVPAVLKWLESWVAQVYRHVYTHVDRHVYAHVDRHVYTHVDRHVYTYVDRHVSRVLGCAGVSTCA